MVVRHSRTGHEWSRQGSTKESSGPVYSSLQGIAIQRGLAIVMADHLRKPMGINSDPVDDVIGSTAKTGIADTVISSLREQGKAGHFLRGRGREIDEFDLKIQFDPETHCYQLLGDAGSTEMTTRRDEALSVLRILDRASAGDVARETGQDTRNTRKVLNDLCNLLKARRETEKGKIYYVSL